MARTTPSTPNGSEGHPTFVQETRSPDASTEASLSSRPPYPGRVRRTRATKLLLGLECSSHVDVALSLSLATSERDQNRPECKQDRCRQGHSPQQLKRRHVGEKTGKDLPRDHPAHEFDERTQGDELRDPCKHRWKSSWRKQCPTQHEHPPKKRVDDVDIQLDRQEEHRSHGQPQAGSHKIPEDSDRYEVTPVGVERQTQHGNEPAQIDDNSCERNKIPSCGTAAQVGPVRGARQKDVLQRLIMLSVIVDTERHIEEHHAQ